MTLTKELLDVELFLFDMDGTVYIGDKEIAGSFDAIRALKKLGKRICFFTNNSSKAAEDYAKNSGVKGFVVGISGGIDSALTSTLCAQTGLPTLCVEMPIHQAVNQVERGREHILYLKNNFNNVF